MLGGISPCFASSVSPLCINPILLPRLHAVIVAMPVVKYAHQFYSAISVLCSRMAVPAKATDILEGMTQPLALPAKVTAWNDVCRINSGFPALYAHLAVTDGYNRSHMSVIS